MTSSPPGFHRIDIVSGFAAEFGPMLVKREGDRVWLGFRVEENHLDGRGFCHGGALATFADMQLAALQRTGARPVVHCPTLSLSFDVLGPARLGDWVECEVELVHAGPRLVFTRALLHLGGAPVARANATYVVASATAPPARPAEPEPAPLDPPPEGFAPLAFGPGFGARFGPVYGRVRDGSARLGFRVARVHINIWGACHGGALATVAQAQAEALRLAGAAPGETVSFAIDYLAPARFGDWVEGEVTLVKATRSFLFSQALLTRAGAPIARASAILTTSLSGS